MTAKRKPQTVIVRVYRRLWGDPPGTGIPLYLEAIDVQQAGLSDGWLRLTSDRSAAKRFASPTEVFALRREVLARDPQRPDGEPKRPFSAFTIQLEPIEERKRVP